MLKARGGISSNPRGPTETHRRAVLKILRGLATEGIAYHTLANENMSLPSISQLVILTGAT